MIYNTGHQLLEKQCNIKPNEMFNNFWSGKGRLAIMGQERFSRGRLWAKCFLLLSSTIVYSSLDYEMERILYSSLLC